MTRKRKRLYLVLGGLGLLAVVTTFVLFALQANIELFYSPSDLVSQEVPSDRTIRIGGLVENGSVKREADGLTLDFKVTDGKSSVPVTYKGDVPDLFREGQGVVAQGKLQQGTFRASSVLAKHDENYMPPEVVDALKRSGHWQEGAKPGPTSSAGAAATANAKQP
jgi:cytochrome c-type biogenesis protein CcmE